MLNPLNYIMNRESGGRNVYNYRYNENPSYYSASGYFQITNSTWRDIAPKAGIDLGRYPTAISAPFDVQQSAATALYNERGFSPWAPFNPKLRSDIAAAGGPGAFIQPGTLTAGADGAAPGLGQGGVDMSDPYAFGRDFNAGNLGDGSQPISSELGSFTDFSDGKTKGGGSLDALIRRRSKDLVEATDKQNRAIRETQQEEGKANRAQDQAQYDATKGTFVDYFKRGAFIVTGLIVLAAGLFMFARPQVNAAVSNVLPIRGARRLLGA